MKKLNRLSNSDYAKLIENEKNYQKLSLAYDLLDQVDDILNGFGDNGVTIKFQTLDFEAIDENDDNIEVSQFPEYLVTELKKYIYDIEMKYLRNKNYKILGIKK